MYVTIFDTLRINLQIPCSSDSLFNAATMVINNHKLLKLDLSILFVMPIELVGKIKANSNR